MCGSTIIGGINSLQERYRNLESYTGLIDYSRAVEANSFNLGGEMIQPYDFSFSGA